MTVLTWPSELPRPERDTWQRQPQDPRQKRVSENGPPGYRRKFSSVAKNITLSVILTRSQKQVFDRFYEVDAKHGSLLFNMPDPTTEGWALLSTDGQLLLQSAGVPLLLSGRWLCLFGESAPTETISGIEFQIRFSVTVMP
jgi:hypothetical protein